MKTSEQIIEDAKNSSDIRDYSLLEMYLYLCIKQILKMFYNRQISKKEANRLKILTIKKYDDFQKQYDFESSLFQEHIKNIRNTENARTRLKKLLNSKEEITEERLAEMFNIALEILSTCFKRRI